MRRLTYAALAAASAIALYSSTAKATVVICTTPNCAPTDENVLVSPATSSVTVIGTTQTTGVTGTYTSSTDLLEGPSSGQARVGATDSLLNSLLFTLDGGATFTSAVFNLSPLSGNQNNEATQVFINYILNGTSYSQPFTIGTNGSNWFGIYGDAGETFTSIGFTADPITTGISDMRQLRLAGVATSTAVPEPGTWMMLVAGLAVVGFSLRRRRRSGRHLLQIA
jgi:hypothetical protein